jgi:hypothetical protein
MDYIHITKKDHLERNKKLQNLLRSLNECDDLSANLERYYNSFFEVYIITKGESTDVYRHSYNDIFCTLLEIQKEQKDPQTLEQLPEKIRACVSYSHKKYSEQKNNSANEKDARKANRVRNCLYKLWDHVSLDVMRINQINILADQSTNTLRNIEYKLKETQSVIDKNQDEVSRIKLDIVAILGVFTAIVIGVVSSVAFSSQLLAHAHEMPVGRVLIAASVCGFVTISIFYVIYSLLEKIVFKAYREQNSSLWTHLQNWRNWSVRDAVIPLTLIILCVTFIVGCLTVNADPVSSSSVTVQISDK